MTQQYRYNTETGQLVEDEGNLGISFYQAPWIEATQAQAEAYELQEAKDSKVAQMKINRDANISKDYTSSQGNELIYNPNTGAYDIGELFYFHFSVKLTSLTATNPEVILREAQESDLMYSCDIIDSSAEGAIRKGYINLTAALSDEISIHVKNRTQDSIIWGNNLEAEINSCNTIAEVDAIDINFDNVN
jgi:hypothetical protein